MSKTEREPPPDQSSGLQNDGTDQKTNRQLQGHKITLTRPSRTARQRPENFGARGSWSLGLDVVDPPPELIAIAERRKQRVTRWRRRREAAGYCRSNGTRSVEPGDPNWRKRHVNETEWAAGRSDEAGEYLPPRHAADADVLRFLRADREFPSPWDSWGFAIYDRISGV